MCSNILIFSHTNNLLLFVKLQDAAEKFEDGNISDSDINNFCSQDCGRFLVRTYETLQEDCDHEFIDDEVTPVRHYK